MLFIFFHVVKLLSGYYNFLSAGGWLPVYLRIFFSFVIQVPLCSNAFGNPGRQVFLLCHAHCLDRPQAACFLVIHQSGFICSLVAST